MVIDDSDWMGGVGSPTKRKLKQKQEEVEEKARVAVQKGLPPPKLVKFGADEV